jgi:methylmalonyl-CoA carboxyltransferase 12S subunit
VSEILGILVAALVAFGVGWWAANRAARRQVDMRLAELESRLRAPEPVPVERPAVAPAPTPPPVEEVTEELVMVISAAVAAFLGCKPRIRAIRRVMPGAANPWAQQGRVSIQASHGFARHASE